MKIQDQKEDIVSKSILLKTYVFFVGFHGFNWIPNEPKELRVPELEISISEASRGNDTEPAMSTAQEKSQIALDGREVQWIRDV